MWERRLPLRLRLLDWRRLGPALWLLRLLRLCWLRWDWRLSSELCQACCYLCDLLHGVGATRAPCCGEPKA